MQTKNLVKVVTPFLLVGCFGQTEDQPAVIEEPKDKQETPVVEKDEGLVDSMAEMSLALNDYFGATSIDPHYGKDATTQNQLFADDIYQQLGRPDLPAAGQCYYYGFSDTGEDYFLAAASGTDFVSIGTNVGKTNANDNQELLSAEQESCLDVEIELADYTIYSVTERVLEGGIEETEG